MAAVSQHAMRRHPGGPLDASAASGSPYYAHAPNLPTDKSKKTWTQRLKISKATDKLLSPTANDTASPNNDSHSPSALSRSMKYTDPVYYGTMRGYPPGVPVGASSGHHPFFSPMREIVVLCSCPEYLNGTKKETKKSSICKKCRGTRLPLTPIGGTVRIHSSTPMIQASRGSAGTVRLPSAYNFKQRPSILAAESDPYDMMRRSRLISPELQPVNNVLKSSGGSSTAASAKNRAKSSSPSRSRRGRSRRRSPSPSQIYGESRSRSISRATTSHHNNGWTNEPDEDTATVTSPGGRRSILHCDLSAYELISKISHNSEFSPIGDDDIYGVDTSNYGKMQSNGNGAKEFGLDATSLSGQRINFTSSKIGSSADRNLYDKVNYAGSDLSSGSQQSNRVRATNKVVDSSPIRPPRGQRKSDLPGANPSGSSSLENESPSAETSPTSDFVLTSAALSHISSDIMITNTSPPPPSTPPVAQQTLSSQQPALPIKSILKRPSSVSSDSPPSSMSGSDLGAANAFSHNNNNRSSATNGSESTIKIAKGKVSISLSKNTTHGPSSVAHSQNSNRITTRHSENAVAAAAVAASAAATAKEKRNSGSHFYLPMPQRKKVQFVVENDIIYDHVSCPVDDQQLSRTATATISSPSVVATTESYFGENDQRHNDISVYADALNGAPAFDDEVTQSKSTAAAANVSREFGNYSVTATTQMDGGVLDADAMNDVNANGKRASSVHVDGGRTRHGAASGTNAANMASNGCSPVQQTYYGLEAATNVGGGAAAVQRDDDNNLPSPKNKTVLRRTLSERRLSNPIETKLTNQVHFNDTTALRAKPERNDTRTIFDDKTSSTAPRIRPKDPPPPPPPSATDTGDKKFNKKPRQPSRPNRPTLADDQTTNIVHISPSSIPQTVEVTSDNITLIVNPVDDKESDEAAKVSITSSDDDHSEQRKRIQANNEAFQGSRLFGLAGKKTVVKVAPLLVDRASSEIHRLEIRNEEDIYESSKKTSIMISGDDCYSTINVNDSQPMYHASVVVNGGDITPEISKSNTNTVSISVTTPTDGRPEFPQHDVSVVTNSTSNRSIIPIDQPKTPESSIHSISQTRTLITVDYSDSEPSKANSNIEIKEVISNDQELLQMLRNPTEAIKLKLIPHVCGKNNIAMEPVPKKSPETRKSITPIEGSSFIGKLLEDPTLGHLAEGLDNELVAKLIENSLLRLKESRTNVDISGTKDEQDMNKLIDSSLLKIKEERLKMGATTAKAAEDKLIDDLIEKQSNRDSMSSANSFSSANYEPFDFDTNELSDCYQSCSSELTIDDDGNVTRSKFYQMLVDATLSEIETSTHHEEDHHYESIRLNGDPIYEEINDRPPPLPLCPPPNDADIEKKNAKSMFEGASKYDILSYLVDAKERGLVPEDSYTYNFSNSSDIIIEEESDKGVERLHNRINSDVSSRISQVSNASDITDEIATLKLIAERKSSSDIERNDSGVGSETSKNSRSKYQTLTGSILNKNSPIHLCEDCDGPVETQITESGVMFAPLVCRKCGKKRAERKEIVTEIIETEEKYSRDLQIILEEFYQPMLVAGLLTQEQLSAIFLNAEELLENSQSLADKMRDAFDIAIDQGDDDLLTVNIGRLLLDAAPMLHAFESYCIRQAAASLLLANMEKEKELLRIFLRVSQMENTVLRRMNLNSFLMVPVQRVTKYPLLLARLYKVTPPHLDGRDLLKQAQEKIELHLNHMNREAKDVPTKLWRRISSSSPNRRSSCEIDMINIKLRKMAIDLLEWHHDEVRFAIEGKLLFTQPNDNNWRKGRTIKLTPVNALLVTNGKPSASYKVDKALADPLSFPRHTGIREATLLLVREKSGRYTLLREPLFLDRCIVCTEADWEDYFEVQEISSKDTFIFKAEDGTRTKQWYTQLQYHSQGMGAWRKRRNALANIMINGMMMRS